MLLFLIQDADRSAYVLAENWQDARNQWIRAVAEENSDLPDEKFYDYDPEGISKIANDNEIILKGKFIS